jgi:hypothetical protein
MASAARTVRPPLATAPKDKLLACLSWQIGLSRESDPDYQIAPFYYDAVWKWYRGLSLGQRDSVSAILTAWSMPDRRKLAETLAAKLPSAPKCPFDPCSPSRLRALVAEHTGNKYGRRRVATDPIRVKHDPSA